MTKEQAQLGEKLLYAIEETEKQIKNIKSTKENSDRITSMSLRTNNPDYSVSVPDDLHSTILNLVLDKQEAILLDYENQLKNI